MSFENAIEVYDACKYYGPETSTKRKQVLDHLYMTVKKGSIYGLLGASGCGKTTLLSCCVGRRRLNSGTIWILGGKPGTPGSGVLGPRVGYMPQEIALVAQFTVKGAIYYFGRIFGMSDKKIEERFRFLSNLFELPPDDRYIRNCSGGQQRRVSFAAAMIHEPELLILDEPTVGLDPLLRESIWNHLVEITQKQKVSVIITTHYIEETRQANCIGLMRHGVLMAEESPSKLLSLFKTDYLEDIFLTLSERQTKGEPVTEFQSEEYLKSKEIKNSEGGINKSKISLIMSKSDDHLIKANSSKKTQKTKHCSLNVGHLKALMTKNILQIVRHPGGLVFSFLFPVLTVLSFFGAIGGDPKGIKMAIVNDESSWNYCQNYTSHSPTVQYIDYNATCSINFLSCRFLDKLNDTVVIKEFYDDLDSAFDAIRTGKIVGAMHFSKNFTDATVSRYEDLKAATDTDVEMSEISVWMDMSNRQIGSHIKEKLYSIFAEFSNEMLQDCNYNPKVAHIPINFHDPIYGSREEKYTTFMAPGIIVTIAFFMSTLLTSSVIITDRLEGIWDRSLVAGVTAVEIMITHIATQFMIMIIQSVETLVFFFLVFGVECKGNPALFGSLAMFQGICGMCYGFLLSVICPSHFMGSFASTGSFYPMILLCGVIWPLEGMPTGLQYFAKGLPFTLPILSLRDIMEKGWGIEQYDVVKGFIATSIWIIILCLFSFVMLRRSMKNK